MSEQEAQNSEPALHWSDCAVHNEPALPAGPCDCAGIEAARLARVGWQPGASWEEEARSLFEDIRANYRGCSPGSREENLWHRISILLGDMPE